MDEKLMNEKLKLDYEQTTRYYHQLAESRFRLLAFVPAVTGASIALLSGATKPELVLTMGFLGFLLTLGIFFYNQRNSQMFDTMIIRAQMLEILLEFETLDNKKHKFAGPFLSRSERSLKLFGVIKIWGDRGLAIIYGAAFGGWTFLIMSSLVVLFNVSQNLEFVVIVGIPILVALAFIQQVHIWDKVITDPNNYPTKVQELLRSNEIVD